MSVVTTVVPRRSLTTAALRFAFAGAVALMALLLVLITPVPSAGATISVSNETQFRNAVAGLTGAAPHTIRITSSFTMSTPGTPEYTAAAPLTIEGVGAGITVTSSTSGSFVHSTTGSVTVVNLSLTNFGTDSLFGGTLSAPFVTLDRVTVSNSTSDLGGAIHGGTITVADSTFTGNYARLGGSALYATTALSVENSTFTGNSTGLIFGTGTVWSAGVTQISHSTFANNTSGVEAAGAYSGGALSVTDTTFHNNHAANQGGAIRAASTAELTRVVITDSDVSGDGGAVHVTGTLTVDSSHFHDNTAERGGAIHAQGHVEINHSSFSGNGAQHGGAVWAESAVTIFGSTFTGNHAVVGGGAVSGPVGDLWVLFSTVINNTGGAGVYAGAGMPTVQTYGSILVNTVSLTPLCTGNGAGSASAGYNYVTDSSCGTLQGTDLEPADVASNPGVMGMITGTDGSVYFPLAPTSALRDAVPRQGCDLVRDQRGIARPQADLCDIGAVEMFDLFSDVPGGRSLPSDPPPHTFAAEISWLAAAGITTGYNDGTFRPSARVSRQAMAAFLFRFVDLVDGVSFTTPSTPEFNDVPTSHPFFESIEWMSATGLSTGYPDGTFRPSDSVSRQAMAAFLFRYVGPSPYSPPATPTFSDVPSSHPFYEEIEWLASTGVTTGYSDGSFRGSAPVSRQAMAAFLMRLYDHVTAAA